MMRSRTIQLLTLAALLVTSTAYAQIPQFIGLTESFDLKSQMPPLTQALEQKNYVDAAARIDALTHDNADALMSTDSGTLVSMRGWAETLSSSTRSVIQPEYDKIVGDVVKQTLESVSAKPGSRPEEFVAIANAYPLSNVVGEALGAAAIRSITFGDLSTAAALQERAIDRGWHPTDVQKTLLDAATKLNTAPGGSLPASAAWYGAEPPVASHRIVPVLTGGMVFFTSERGVVAARENGDLAWQWMAPKADPAMSGARLGFHRPAVVCDPAGKPQIVIVRQLVGGTRFGCLRAFRATDGKQLWTTENMSSLGSWSLASAPVAAGRTVVVLAIDEASRPAALGAFAFEVTTGRYLWSTPLGSYTNLGEGDEPGSWREVDALWSNSGVAIDGSEVFVNAATGFTASLDRFDGKVRWIRPYTRTPTPGEELLDLDRRMSRGEGKLRETFKNKLAELKGLAGKDFTIQKTEIKEKNGRREHEPDPTVKALASYFSRPVRWMSTPAVSGDVVVVAASDMAGVVGLDRRTGLQLWEIPDAMKQATLIGATSKAAVFAESDVKGIDVHSAATLWTWTAATEPIAGPPAMAGRSVRVLTGKTTIVVNADTGSTESPVPAGSSMVGPLGEGVRNALQSVDAQVTVGFATVRPGDTKKR